jgi:hypothetical protein
MTKGTPSLMRPACQRVALCFLASVADAHECFDGKNQLMFSAGDSTNVRSAEFRVLSASAGCGVRSASAECGVRSAECRGRSAECRGRSAECGVRQERTLNTVLSMCRMTRNLVRLPFVSIVRRLSRRTRDAHVRGAIDRALRRGCCASVHPCARDSDSRCSTACSARRQY